MRKNKPYNGWTMGKYNASATITPKNILWSRNWYHLVDCKVPSWYYSAVNTNSKQSDDQLTRFFSGCSGIIWIRTVDASTFAGFVLTEMKKPFVLITTDGDHNVPSRVRDFQKILDSPLCTAWYTQNYDGSSHHPKLIPVPIGFDLHTKRYGYWGNVLSVNLAHMLALRRRGLKNERRNQTLYLPPWNPKTHTDRPAVETAIECIPHVRGPSMNISDLWESYTNYKFSLAPRGNGIDTHRMWEMLFFGIVPITLTSSIDVLFEGLPVIVVQNYTDICREGFLDEAWSRIETNWPAPDHVFTTRSWIRKEHLGG